MSFDEKVWEICRKIPAGKVMTYRTVAESLGSKGYRAVGNSLHRNPYWPDVPCHRVVCSDGSLGGFASGVARKRKLLKDEGILFREGKVDIGRCLHVLSQD
jgi:methylated-DNA-[protein]-cysteine S-methyltransferase